MAAQDDRGHCSREAFPDPHLAAGEASARRLERAVASEAIPAGDFKMTRTVCAACMLHRNAGLSSSRSGTCRRIVANAAKAALAKCSII
jgi:hypothetical protein